MPCVSRLVNGSSTPCIRPVVAHHALDRSANRAGAGSRARCRRCTGRPASSSRRARRPSPCRWSGQAKRTKYQDESTNVSIVSVSRSRRPAALRTLASRRTPAVLLSGLPVPSGTRSSGSTHRQLLVGHRHVAALRAVDDRDRAAPVALARDAPVAQAPVHLLLARALRLQIGGDRIDRLLVIEPVVLAGVDADAVLGVLGLATADRRASPSAMADHRLDRQAVLAARTRSRARRAPARPSPRLRRSPSARSCRPRPASSRR